MTVYTRSDWGAGPHRAGVIRLPVSRYFLHHTVTPFWVGVQAARNVQAIARSRGFVDISYSWLTDRQGNEIEGRGWGRQGAHTVGYNSTAHALSLVGNLDSTPVPNGMVLGIVRLIRRHRGYGPGRITHPHSAVSQTACPGRYARADIPKYNSLAAGSSTPTPPKEGFPMGLSDGEQDKLYTDVVGDGRLKEDVINGRAILARMDNVLNQLTDDTDDSRTVHDRAKRALTHARNAETYAKQVNERLDGVEAMLKQLLAKET